MVELFIENEKKKGHSVLYAKEIKIYQKKIDLIEISRKKGSGIGDAIGIEFKIRDWQRCLVQAKKNRVLLPLNAIAIWHSHCMSIDVSYLKSTGIGLISVSDSKNSWIVRPAKSKYVDEGIHKKIRANIISENEMLQNSFEMENCL